MDAEATQKRDESHVTTFVSGSNLTECLTSGIHIVEGANFWWDWRWYQAPTFGHDWERF